MPNPSKLCYGDSILLETIVEAAGMTLLAEIQSELEAAGDCSFVMSLDLNLEIKA